MRWHETESLDPCFRPRYKDFRGKVAGGLQAAVQDSPLPNVAEDPAAAERGKQIEHQLEARLDELETRFETRALAIDAMATDEAVCTLLVPLSSLPAHEQDAHELAIRQAIDIVVVRHLARHRSAASQTVFMARPGWAGVARARVRAQVATVPDFAGFSLLYATCVSSNLGNIASVNATRDVNCYAVCVEGGETAQCLRSFCLWSPNQQTRSHTLPCDGGGIRRSVLCRVIRPGDARGEYHDARDCF